MARRWLTHPATVRACQVILGIVFAWAALAKIGDPRAFAADVHNFRLVPVALENLVAVTLPWVELVAAMALVLGVRARSGAVVSLLLMALFTVAVAAAVARGLDVECGCFGTADGSAVGARKLLENVALLVLAAIASLGRGAELSARWRG
jgi:uncharacterized membrane protein YphA (DoxX/SURF4 family)